MSRQTKRLLVALSGHGFGHAAQAAPVVNALRLRLPELEVTLWSDVDEALLRSRFDGAFELQRVSTDVGMVMDSALDVRIEDSARAYVEFHRSWERDVAEEAARMEGCAPDLVVCDVPYRPIAAASRLAIPAVALCSLEWADVYRDYCGQLPGSDAIHAVIAEAYAQAELFVAPEPSMPMPSISEARAVGPIARPARSRRSELMEALAVAAGTKIVLVALGGIPTELAVARWSVPEDHLFLVPRAWNPTRPGFVDFESLLARGFHYSELLMSSDAVLTKPGYNGFVECGVGGIPVLYVARGDWPEEPNLASWLSAHTRCREISRAELESGDFMPWVRRLIETPAPPSAQATGAEEAATILEEYLR